MMDDDWVKKGHWSFGSVADVEPSAELEAHYWGEWRREHGSGAFQWIGWQSARTAFPDGLHARLSCYIYFVDSVPPPSNNFGFKFQGQVENSWLTDLSANAWHYVTATAQTVQSGDFNHFLLIFDTVEGPQTIRIGGLRLDVFELSQCPAGYFSSLASTGGAANSRCVMCKGYEVASGRRDGVSHSARGARAYADVIQSPWSSEKGLGGIQVRRILDGTNNPICPKGHWLQDKCSGGYGFPHTHSRTSTVTDPDTDTTMHKYDQYTHTAMFSSAQGDNTCQACTGSKPLDSHFDFPLHPFEDSCPWTCNAGRTQWRVDGEGRLLDQTCDNYDHDSSCRCLACSSVWTCGSGKMIKPCTPSQVESCMDCFGYSNGNLRDRQFCGRGYFLLDFCADVRYAGFHNSSEYPSRCIKCFNYKPLHAYYLYPHPILTSECEWECFPGYERVPAAAGVTCVPCATLECYPLASSLAALNDMQQGLPSPQDLSFISGSSLWLANPMRVEAFTTQEQRSYNSTLFLTVYAPDEAMDAEVHLAAFDFVTLVVNGSTVGKALPALGEQGPHRAVFNVSFLPGSNIVAAYVHCRQGSPALLMAALHAGNGNVLFQTNDAWRVGIAGSGPFALVNPSTTSQWPFWEIYSPTPS